ncbi:hypothetical protein [Bacillus sp. UNC41MFS5]|uniref:hypothetical protein n=1 Tax=Bacillus sp. UNC41MFS5 TaxID=1449046 RepID=UPI00047C6EF7|nr:hypothetical protein [Bacillus sp. UNC41MFS5]
MTILEFEVVVLIGNNLKYYENLGYEIPKRIDTRGVLRYVEGTTISVKVEHLQIGSNVPVTRVCDDCGEVANGVKYYKIINARRKVDGKDRCKSCAYKISQAKKVKKYIEDGNSIAETNPHLASLFLNKEDSYNNTQHSSKKAYFVCPDCKSVMFKTIGTVCVQGLGCATCSDGVSYSEKFLIQMLKQLEVKYATQKLFKWSQRKRYDFFIGDKNMIIEAHGSQHYQETTRGRSLKEEQENDLLKYKNAISNGIDNYIVLDCRESEMGYVKNSILNSELNGTFDLSSIDWEACHKNSLTSFAYESWKLYEEGLSLMDISNKLGIGNASIRKYLKQGAKVGMCSYTTENWYEKREKPILQISLDGELIKEHRGLRFASRHLGKPNHSNILDVLQGRQSTAYGFNWIYKEDYEKYLSGKLSTREDNNRSPVVQISLDDEYIKTHNSIESARKELCIPHAKGITAVCKGRQKTAYGFKWMYKEDYNK